MTDLPEPDVVASRARAALAFADIELTKRGQSQSVGSISGATMARIISSTNPRGALKVEELWEIADVCGVPRSFMERGFIDDAPAPEERIEAVEHRLRTISELVRGLDERMLPFEERLDAVAVLLPLVWERLGILDQQPTDETVAQALETVLGRTA